MTLAAFSHFLAQPTYAIGGPLQGCVVVRNQKALIIFQGEEELLALGITPRTQSNTPETEKLH